MFNLKSKCTSIEFGLEENLKCAFLTLRFAVVFALKRIKFIFYFIIFFKTERSIISFSSSEKKRDATSRSSPSS